MAHDLHDSSAPPPSGDQRALKIMAKSLYRDLRTGGYNEKDVLCLAGELLSLISSEVEGRRSAAAAALDGAAPR
jgi:hypothetical protein